MFYKRYSAFSAIFATALMSGCGMFQSPTAPDSNQQMAAFIAHEHKVHTSANQLKAVSDGPKNRAHIYTALGIAYLQANHPRQAVRETQRAVDTYAGDANAYNVMGLAYEQLNQHVLAHSAFRHAVSMNGKNPEYRNNYGAFLVRSGNYKGAIHQLDIATKDPLYSTPQFAWTNMAEAYIHMHNDHAARTSIQHALYLMPNYGPAMELKAEMDFTGGDMLSAYNNIKIVLDQNPNNAGALLLAGNIAEKQGLQNQAHHLWTQCVNADPYSVAGQKAQHLLLEHNK